MKRCPDLGILLLPSSPPSLPQSTRAMNEISRQRASSHNLLMPFSKREPVSSCGYKIRILTTQSSLLRRYRRVEMDHHTCIWRSARSVKVSLFIGLHESYCVHGVFCCQTMTVSHSFFFESDTNSHTRGHKSPCSIASKSVLRSRHLRVEYVYTLPTQPINDVRSRQPSSLVDCIGDLAGVWAIFYRQLSASISYRCKPQRHSPAYRS